jgi:uncharacterized protein
MIPRVILDLRGEKKRKAIVSIVVMIVQEEIKKFGQLIAERFSPEKIILFGSFAYGTPTADSDVDILVVMPYTDDVHTAAFSIKSVLPRPFPLDLIVRSPEELQVRLSKDDLFIRNIIENGIVLYERGN